MTTELGASNSDRELPPAESRIVAPVWPKWAIVFLLVGHAVATCICFWPVLVSNPTVLAHRDFPYHARNCHINREAMRESGFPWAYDPAVCGGTVVLPPRDVSSTLFQFFSMILPWFEARRIVTVCASALILMAPFMLVAAGRMFGLDWEEIAWGLLLAEGLLWFAMPYRLLLEDGMVTFLTSTYICLFVLAAYQRFLIAPSVRGYAGAVAAGCFLLFVHILGPVAILPSLVVLVAFLPGVAWRWRLAAAVSPLIIAAVNAFWLFRIPLAMQAPPVPWLGLATDVPRTYWMWESWVVAKYFGVAIAAGHLVAIPVAVAGLIRIGRRHSWVTCLSLGLVFGWSLFLFAGGSFVPVTQPLQPLRFVVVLWTVIAILAGCCIAWLCARIRILKMASAASFGVVATALALAFYYLGPSVRSGPDTAAMVEFIQSRTGKNDRLAIQAIGPFGRITYDLPRAVGREVIGSTFPDPDDPLQFVGEELFGKSAEESSIEETRESLHRFGVNWVIARKWDWHEFFREMTGSEGVMVGRYRAFEISTDTSRFLVGAGDVEASVNRIELRNVQPRDGYVVIQYRYHPGWVCDAPASVEQYPVPEHPAGLLLVRNPPTHLVLRFDPFRAVSESWPASEVPGKAAAGK
jgi:hypothetical protein